MTAAEAIGEASEKAPAQRPAEEESSLDPRAVEPDQRIPATGNAQQLGDERSGDQHVQVHIEAVKQPAEPRRDAGFPLLRGEIAQPRHLTSGDYRGERKPALIRRSAGD